MGDRGASRRQFAQGVDARGVGTDEDEREYLQFHALVAFHGMLFDMDMKALVKITGKNHSPCWLMLFVNPFEDVLSLDLGFFYLEDGKYLEPAPIRNGTSLERYHYPIVSSGLLSENFLIEADENIRYSLYNHPLEVVGRLKKFSIIAHKRNAGRYPARIGREGLGKR